MQILNLTINNFGVFRGRHKFDFTPVATSDQPARHLTVISGQNGVGKSTLFQSLRLAFHGSLALGDRVSQQAYSDYLLSRLHRFNQSGETVTSDEAGLTLSFQYVQSGQPLLLEINRQWKRVGQNVFETLDVRQNGEPVNAQSRQIEFDSLQAYLNELMPPGLAPLCFFDAERLEAMSSPEQYEELLGDSLRRLLGLDIVERLQADLDQLTKGEATSRRAIGRLRDEIVVLWDSLQHLNGRIKALEDELKQFASDGAKLEGELAKQVRRLSDLGGDHAGSKPVLEDRLNRVKKELADVSHQLAEMCGELLPFALAPELCLSLSQRLKEEEKQRSLQIADSVWQERIATVETRLQQSDLWGELKLGKKKAAVIEQVIKELHSLNAGNTTGNYRFVHNLAEPEAQKIQGWIHEALYVVPNKVKALGDRIKQLQAEQREIETKLQQAPESDLLGPLQQEVARLQAEVTKVHQRRDELNRELGVLQYQREEQTKQYQTSLEQLRQGQRLELAERSKLVLRTYQDALTRQQIERLEEELVLKFNAICRKEHLLGAVRINPDNFRTTLSGADGHVISLSDFSAGERQLYALALLWALREISGRQLPLAIDTPLARMDSTHRQRFIQDYVSVVSNQVILFVTDAEFDIALLPQVELNATRIYSLMFDDKN